MTGNINDYFEHVVEPGERWDTIAWKYYSDPEKMDVIIAANDDDQINFKPIPPVLKSGTVLKIPVIEQDPIPDDILPPWRKKNVASQNQEAYDEQNARSGK